jgi:hypothetical protein
MYNDIEDTENYRPSGAIVMVSVVLDAAPATRCETVQLFKDKADSVSVEKKARASTV